VDASCRAKQFLPLPWHATWDEKSNSGFVRVGVYSGEQVVPTYSCDGHYADASFDSEAGFAVVENFTDCGEDNPGLSLSHNRRFIGTKPWEGYESDLLGMGSVDVLPMRCKSCGDWRLRVVLRIR
jgi:hypothetical protein